LFHAPTLKTIDYSPDAGKIILGVDASIDGYGGNLSQESKDNPKLRHVICFVSGIWSEAERMYDAGKLELHALVHCVCKLHLYLYGTRFIVETDAATLVAIINRVSTDLPGSLVQRWLAWLHLFDFDIRHVPGKKNGAADALSRQPKFHDNIPMKPEFDLDEWIDEQLDSTEHHAYGSQSNKVVHLVVAASISDHGNDAPEPESVVHEGAAPWDGLGLLDEHGNALDGLYSEEHHEIA
jgi:hypothetical protein